MAAARRLIFRILLPVAIFTNLLRAGGCSTVPAACCRRLEEKGIDHDKLSSKSAKEQANARTQSRKLSQDKFQKLFVWIST